ncbi:MULTISPECIES: ABC transporter ATP-binding protein [unclassified Paenibacillus]|nr:MULTISPECIES: ABC transporter ATP-binding protein [unclassified Paenibacillus]MDH6425632.1 ATP-binding cassette subfamily B protein [Paenibacillus sp. PastH-4]MDH6441652.1 ATP-binding cassette subfamily B protein [Paenibacillus sp. PastF-4]MDH6529837.1 ATP-binding cassette subfamily B protein [Paenibacillus sp. PastH-3]
MKQKGVFSRLSTYMLRHKLLYTILLFTTLFGIVLDLTIAWLLSVITDAAVRLDVKAFKGLVIFGLIYLLVSAINGFIDRYFKNKISVKIRNELRLDMMRHALALPQSYFDRNHSGDLLSRFTNDNQSVGNAAGEVMIDLIRNPLLALAAFGYLLYINWLLALICFAMGPLMFLTGKIFGSAMRENSVKIQTNMSKITSFLHDILGSSMVFKSFSIERRLMKQYQEHSENITSEELKRGRIEGATGSFSSFLGNFTFLLALVVAGYFVAKGSLEVGAMIAFIQLMNYLVMPFSSLPGLINSMQQSLGAAGRIFEVLDSPVEVETLPEVETKQPEFESMVMSSISFSYPGAERQSINKISLELQKGTQMAVVGPSGGGKSTLFKLLLGLYEPDEGEVIINGQRINEMSLAKLRSYFSYVPQEAGLYTGSIRDNIRNGNPEADEQEILEALRKANAYDFVMELPEGLDTDIGEEGSRLSGGQRQRLSIARAILRNAPILLLDEATAALDNESEKLVQQAIRKLMGDKTTLVIAHRLSTIQNADIILVMENGEIVESGTHDVLLAAEGRYNDLYYSQLEQEEESGMGPEKVELASTGV